MTRVIAGEDCGNSPKNKFILDITAAFATGDVGFILDRVSEDIVWEVVGRMRIEGKTAFAAALEGLKKEPAAEIEIYHVATHGRAGAANAETRLEDGRRRAFANVYVFSSVKADRVKEITSYVIDL